jgi:3-oxoadipate enol-lactonase
MLPPLVLLHGLGTGPEAWRPQIDALSESRTVVAPPLDAAFDQMDGIGAPFDLCGLSLGALRALAYVTERPPRVRRLVLCAGFASLPLHLKLLQYAIASIVSILPAGPVRRGLVSAVPEEHRPKALEDLRDLSGRELGRIMREGARFRMLRAPAVPTLVLCGERDRLNKKLSERLARAVPGARFALVPEAGHVANLDNPQAFTELLLEFLGE